MASANSRAFQEQKDWAMSVYQEYLNLQRSTREAEEQKIGQETETMSHATTSLVNERSSIQENPYTPTKSVDGTSMVEGNASAK
jgi:stress response protein YsnF